MALAGELGPMDQRAALTKVVDYVKHRPLCQSGGGNDWTDEDTASCSCGLSENRGRAAAARPRSRERLARAGGVPPFYLTHRTQSLTSW
jgi:hypothetical protein